MTPEQEQTLARVARELSTGDEADKALAQIVLAALGMHLSPLSYHLHNLAHEVHKRTLVSYDELQKMQSARWN